jgi:hypothetical protein
MSGLKTKGASAEKKVYGKVTQKWKTRKINKLCKLIENV